MLFDYQADSVLGPIAKDALNQNSRLKAQQESYRSMVERRFGEGKLSTSKILSVEKSSNEAVFRSFLGIANRMEAFNSQEYLTITSGAS